MLMVKSVVLLNLVNGYTAISKPAAPILSLAARSFRTFSVMAASQRNIGGNSRQTAFIGEFKPGVSSIAFLLDFVSDCEQKFNNISPRNADIILVEYSINCVCIIPV